MHGEVDARMCLRRADVGVAADVGVEVEVDVEVDVDGDVSSWRWGGDEVEVGVWGVWGGFGVFGVWEFGSFVSGGEDGRTRIAMCRFGTSALVDLDKRASCHLEAERRGKGAKSPATSRGT